MKKGLLKNRIQVILFLFCLVGCKKMIHKDFDYTDFTKLKESHSFIDEALKDSIKNILSNQLELYDFEQPIYILDVEKVEEHFVFCFTKTDYFVFKNYRSAYFDNPKGYLKFEDIPLLLFGNVDSIFFNKKDNSFSKSNVLGNLPKYDKDNPPVIYEPNFICIEIKR